MSGNRIDAQDEDWAALLAVLGDAELVDRPLEDDDDLEELLAPSEEVRNVSRRIAGQYVEILADFAAGAFGRRTDPIPANQVRAAVEALLRLAQAAEDTVQVRLLNELLELIGPITEGSSTSRTRQTALARFRTWIPRFADTLERTDAERLIRLVRWERGSVPLLEELRSLRGIGPKRLERLYSAGLFTIDTVASARPADIVAVTGIPLGLAKEIVRATERFAATERLRVVDELREGAAHLRHILTVYKADDPDFYRNARLALQEVERTLTLITRLES